MYTYCINTLETNTAHIYAYTYIHTGYNHTDNDTYVPDIPKVACSLNTMNSFEINGKGANSYTCIHTYIHTYTHTYIIHGAI